VAVSQPQPSQEQLLAVAVQLIKVLRVDLLQIVWVAVVVAEHPQLE
jgi:hypothetical protein